MCLFVNDIGDTWSEHSVPRQHLFYPFKPSTSTYTKKRNTIQKRLHINHITCNPDFNLFVVNV